MRRQMEGNRARVLAVALLIAGAFPVQADWWIETGNGFQSIGGAARLGPYPTREEAEAVNRQSFNGQATVTSSDTSGGGGVPGGTAASDPRVQAAGAAGAAVGNAIGQAIGKAIVGDPQAEAQRKAEAEWAARLQQQLEQQRLAAQARKNQEIFNRLAAELKLPNGGGDGIQGGLTLKKTDSGPGLQLKFGDSAAGIPGPAGGVKAPNPVALKLKTTPSAPGSPGTTNHSTSQGTPSFGIPERGESRAQARCSCGGAGCKCAFDTCANNEPVFCACGGVDCDCTTSVCPKFGTVTGCTGFSVCTADGKKHCNRHPCH